MTIFLRIEVQGNKILVVQFGLPRSLRNLDQAGQVDPFEGEGALQPLSLDKVTPVGDCTRSSRKHTYLDVLLYPLPNLLRQLGACDWSPFFAAVMSGIYLTVVLARRMLVVKVSCL